jgi:acetyl esterase/lipase
MFVEPKNVPYEQFPASNLQADGMKILTADLTPRYGMVDLNVEYAVKDGRSLHLQILRPVFRGENPSPTFPLIVFVQGSAWFEQALGANLAGLLDFTKRGFVVAIVEYRPSTTAIFPAQIKDVKTAIRFMLKHSTLYNVDPKKITVWGDSSGGHTVSMVNVTLHDAEYTDEKETPPLDVKVFVDYYGPSDIGRMNEQPSIMDHISPDSPEGSLIGHVQVDKHPELVAPTIPMNHIDGRYKPRPQLIIHGDKDRLVPFQQSTLLYEALRGAGVEVEFYKLVGADHGGPPFWTGKVLDIVEKFIRKWS